MSTPLRRMVPSLETAENAIVAALAADPVIAAYQHSIAGFQGTLAQAIEEGSYPDPAILVIFMGGPFEGRGIEKVLHAEWQIVVRDRNLRGNEYQRKPQADGEIGTYQMIQDVCRVLDGQDLDLDGMEPLQVEGIELLAASENRDRTLSAYLVVFSTTLDWRVVAPEQALEQVNGVLETRNGAGTWKDVTQVTIELES